MASFEKEWTEPVVFFISHYIHYKTMPFLLILFCISLFITIMVKEENVE